MVQYKKIGKFMALYIEITVVPRSGRQEIQQSHIGLKCFLKEAPENGRANQELIRFLSKQLGIIQQDIEIISGGSGRKKRLKLAVDWSLDEFLHKVGIE